MKTLKTFKHIALLIGMLLMSLVSVGQTESLTVYDGNITSTTIPMYVFWFDDYTRSQFIIPSDDLCSMNGGIINTITFYTTNNNIPYTTSAAFEMYLKEVDYTSISSYEDENTMTCIYTSNTGNFVTEGSGGKITFENVNFSYNGGNLLIACKNTTDAGWKGIYFYGQTSSGSSIGGYNSSANGTIPANQQDFIPKTTFTFTGATGICCDIPVITDNRDGTIEWTGNSDSYIVYVYKIVKTTQSTNENTYTIPNLDPDADYYVKVESRCGKISDSISLQINFPLPIKLLSFTGTPYYSNFNKWEYNLIEWSTATETNNDYFILESSQDAVHFKEIYRTSGAGNSIEALDYDFKDYNPVADITYYRLTQVDYDGSKTTSEIIECKRTSDEKVSKRIMVYPNPAKDEVTIINTEGANILIINQLGQIVLSLENAADNQTINVTNFANGTYFVKIGSTVEKLVISK